MHDAEPVAGDKRNAAASASFDAADPRSADAIESMTAYFDELEQTFPTGFDPGDTLTADAHQFDEPSGAFVVARVIDEVGSHIVGCGGVRTLEPGIAEIKRMWVAADWRGLGLAKRLLADLEGRAASIGHRLVRLDTNATLTNAIAMYERAGYRAIGRYNENPFAQCWFEKRLA